MFNPTVKIIVLTGYQQSMPSFNFIFIGQILLENIRKKIKVRHENTLEPDSQKCCLQQMDHYNDKGEGILGSSDIKRTNRRTGRMKREILLGGRDLNSARREWRIKAKKGIYYITRQSTFHQTRILWKNICMCWKTLKFFRIILKL